MKISEFRFHVECTPDEWLLRALGVPQKKIKHWRDKGRVCKHLQKARGVVGLIDEDPAQTSPSWLRSLQLEEYPQHGLKVHRGSSCLIIVCPRLEEWLLQAAKEVKVDPARFGFPGTGEDLHEVISNNRERFDNFIQEVCRKRSPRLQQLQSLIAERYRKAQ